MTKGTTMSGFKYSVDENNLDNLELVEALAELDAGNTLALSKVGVLLLGKKTYEELKEYLKKNNDGVAPVSVFQIELKDIMQGIESGKKS